MIWINKQIKLIFESLSSPSWEPLPPLPVPSWWAELALEFGVWADFPQETWQHDRREEKKTKQGDQFDQFTVSGVQWQELKAQFTQNKMMHPDSLCVIWWSFRSVSLHPNISGLDGDSKTGIYFLRRSTSQLSVGLSSGSPDADRWDRLVFFSRK